MSRVVAWIAGVVLALWLSGLEAEPRAPVVPKAGEAWFIDDEQVFANLMDKLAAQARAGRMLPAEKLKARLREGPVAVTPTRPTERTLPPEDVYQAALPSVFVLGSVVKEKDEWLDGRYATAWVVAADGVLVTNWHVFADMDNHEVFGAADHLGNVYPLTDFLGGNKAMDVAVFRIAATNLVPLPLATTPGRVASWVGVLSHPGDQFYTFTQGHVSRYSQSTLEDGTVEKWLNITADYATGSSGGPVLNRQGAVVGMAAMTVSIDVPDEPKGKPEGGRAKPKEMPDAASSTLQMVTKLAVPASQILRVLENPAPRK